MNCAGAALAGVAADVGAGQSQLFAQKIHQQRARFDGGLVPNTIDCYTNRHCQIFGLSSHAQTSSSNGWVDPGEFSEIDLSKDVPRDRAVLHPITSGLKRFAAELDLNLADLTARSEADNQPWRTRRRRRREWISSR